MGASQACSLAATDHPLHQPDPPAWRGEGDASSFPLPGLDGSALQRQPRWWTEGRVGETGGSPQAGGGLGGRGPICLDLTQRLHFVLLRPHLQDAGRWRHREAGRQGPPLEFQALGLSLPLGIPQTPPSQQFSNPSQAPTKPSQRPVGRGEAAFICPIVPTGKPRPREGPMTCPSHPVSE